MSRLTDRRSLTVMSRSLGSRIQSTFARRITRWLGRRPFKINPVRPLISFTFDDFPASALAAGGTILEQHGARGTYYVAMGLMGRKIETGSMFDFANLVQLLEMKHELGCHTFHHYPAWETSTDHYEASVRQNAAELAKLQSAIRPQTHSYPISSPRPSTKRRLASRFRACRLGGQSSNRGVVDLNALNSLFIEQTLNDFGGIEKTIANNATHSGWLIFSTHDIATNHSPFGCSPHFFTKIVDAAIRSEARILTVGEALDELGVPALVGRGT